jgi:hypothetical protein
MRNLVGFIGLLAVLATGGLIYSKYFTQSSGGTGVVAPTQTIDVVGVKSDLLGIAQAERVYQAQHGSYASMDDLVSSGALSMSKPGRDGYTYDVETSADSFRVVARCPSTSSPGCTNYAVDQTMQVQPTP